LIPQRTTLDESEPLLDILEASTVTTE
jgi:hypothetical protein